MSAYWFRWFRGSGTTREPGGNHFVSRLKLGGSRFPPSLPLKGERGDRNHLARGVA